ASSAVYGLTVNVVVLAQVVAGLHLDHFDVLGARIFQAMAGLCRDMQAVADGQMQLLVAACRQCGAAHHSPVFSAVVVVLQRQLATRNDANALDLETIAGSEFLEMAPGPFCQALCHCLCRVGMRVRHQYASVDGSASSCRARMPA